MGKQANPQLKAAMLKRGMPRGMAERIANGKPNSKGKKGK